MMIIGNTFLLVGAVGCVFAPSISWLLISRFIHGIGVSTSVVVFAIIADSYKGDEAVKFIGIMNSTLTVLIAIAPILGGFINEIDGWRGNYASVAILCFISWILLLFLLPETKKDRDIFSLKKMIKDYKKLLSSSKFIALIFDVEPFFCRLYVIHHLWTFFLYMKTFGLSSAIYALHQGAMVGSFSLISLFSDKISQRLGGTKCVIFGTGVIAIGSLFLLIFSITVPHSYYLVTFSMIIFYIGCGICQAVSAAILVFSAVTLIYCF